MEYKRDRKKQRNNIKIEYIYISRTYVSAEHYVCQNDKAEGMRFNVNVG